MFAFRIPVNKSAIFSMECVTDFSSYIYYVCLMVFLRGKFIFGI